MAKRTSTRAKKAPGKRTPRNMGLPEWRAICQAFRDLVAECRDAGDPLQRATEEDPVLWRRIMRELQRIIDALPGEEKASRVGKKLTAQERKAHQDACDRTNTFYGVWDSQDAADMVWEKAQALDANGSVALREGLPFEELNAREDEMTRRDRLHGAMIGIDPEYEAAVLARYLLRYHEHFDPKRAYVPNPDDGGKTQIDVARRAVEARYPQVTREYDELMWFSEHFRQTAEPSPDGNREKYMLHASDERAALHRRMQDLLDAGSVDAVKAAYLPEELTEHS